MPILPQFNRLLQFSLIHNPGLLSREYGLPLLDIENISDINDELSLELRWNQFLNVDHQAQKLFESSGFRLGILAESIFENWLREHKIDFRRGLQVFEPEPSRKTLGELDFLYYHDKCWTHFELAAKIYCFRPQYNDYIGPNKRDFFHRKLDSLEQKQLPLISNPSTVKILKNQGIENITKSQVHFCGRLFYPPGQWDIPDYVNCEHAKGIYYENHLPLDSFQNNQSLVLLPRYLWFLPEINLTELSILKFTKGQFAQMQWASVSEKEDIYQLEQVLKHYTKLGKTTMLAVLEYQSEKWREIQRILLLPHSMN